MQMELFNLGIKMEQPAAKSASMLPMPPRKSLRLGFDSPVIRQCLETKDACRSPAGPRIEHRWMRAARSGDGMSDARGRL